MDAKLEEILNYLNDVKRRAHYGAVAGRLGVTPRSVGVMLGDHSQRASWIVSKDSNLPTDYEEENIHPELERTSLIIQTPEALDRGLQFWKQENTAAAK